MSNHPILHPCQLTLAAFKFLMAAVAVHSASLRMACFWLAVSSTELCFPCFTSLASCRLTRCLRLNCLYFLSRAAFVALFDKNVLYGIPRKLLAQSLSAVRIRRVEKKVSGLRVQWQDIRISLNVLISERICMKS